ncbi:MAG: hypothetical protein WDN76_09395 [Alphaproteobacteria bacterium]
MTLDVDPMKVMRLFAPLWALLAISLWVHWEEWLTKPALFGAIAFLPLAAAGAAWLMRNRWRLELTPEGLIHRTLGRTERFEWARMGPLTMKRAPLSDLLFVRAFWFAYPLDGAHSLEEHAAKLIGRRLLCVFGDRPPKETIKIIEDWRALYSKPATATLSDSAHSAP